jgi:hypothetical protein
LRAAADTIAELWPLRSFCRKAGPASVRMTPR